MKRLGLAEARARRALDFTILSAILTPYWTWTAHASASAWSRKEPPVRFEPDGWRAQFYAVTYRLPLVLSGPGQYMTEVTVCFDTSAPTYPLTAPTTRVVSTPIPWSSHFAAGGTVCLGEIWNEARGRMALCQLVLHVLKLINLDEPRHDHPGFSPAASAYWATALNYRPLNRGLRYPTLPTALYDGSLKAPVPPSAIVPGQDALPRFRPIN